MNPEQKARAKEVGMGILVDVLFTSLPFAVMAVVFSVEGNLLDVFSEPEWAFAAVVLSGQAVVRFVRGIASVRAKVNRVALALAVIIVLVLVPSSIVLVLMLTTQPLPLMLIGAQVVLFLLAMVIFSIFGFSGDLLEETYTLERGSQKE